ncbi:hypothetical protein CBR_g47992 [Chara braunii]|uniref:Uncharacterized protein n=1 Tax=Chara braunii TaxID=69332 RepID=A0A388M1U2_CHABU|nr:hypothetical protein CBR_g47992 [Chara braunii]|eukprot:GBG88521.1 hypothetical protein CBR_g47992 [Chara braunii]
MSCKDDPKGFQRIIEIRTTRRCEMYISPPRVRQRRDDDEMTWQGRIFLVPAMLVVLSTWTTSVTSTAMAAAPLPPPPPPPTPAAAATSAKRGTPSSTITTYEDLGKAVTSTCYPAVKSDVLLARSVPDVNQTACPHVTPSSADVVGTGSARSMAGNSRALSDIHVASI